MCAILMINKGYSGINTPCLVLIFCEYLPLLPNYFTCLAVQCSVHLAWPLVSSAEITQGVTTLHSVEILVQYYTILCKIKQYIKQYHTILYNIKQNYTI